MDNGDITEPVAFCGSTTTDRFQKGSFKAYLISNNILDKQFSMVKKLLNTLTSMERVNKAVMGSAKMDEIETKPHTHLTC